ncbi:MAG TPA: hypothetical protein VNU70_10475 [Puia sp.]|nr:hypothetical protein [Puia sp.]
MGYKEIWSKIVKSGRVMPVRLAIPADHTDKAAILKTPFKLNEQYFTVRVNEMYLSYSRKWLKEWDPVVFITSEFVYDNEKLVVPFVVGPSILNTEGGTPVPEGMIFRDTTVAGTHPFRGDPFTLSIVLARLKQEDYLRKILKLIESTSHTYMGGFATMVKEYIKVATVVLDGIDDLLDSKDIEPLIGHRNTVMQNAGDEFYPGYFVLINTEEQGVDPKKFFVVDNQLKYGNSLADAQPYREHDYVLYSIMSTEQRNDCDLLPFKKEWVRLLQFATGLSTFSEENWLQVKGKLFALQGTLRLSPDLTRKQITELIASYKQEIDAMKEDRDHLGVAEESLPAEKADGWNTDMDKMALDILKL